jgi:peroxiredoxin
MKNVLITVLFIIAVCTVNAQVKVDAMAPEISLPNSIDSIIHLSSLKGKVVLIDFWASWCTPCRQSIPNVVRLYKKYKDEGFEVYGVSIDANKNEWLDAVAHDKITYTQVNDKMGWNSTFATEYGVDAIPATFLLDRMGKIISIDIERHQLEKEIKRLLKRK